MGRLGRGEALRHPRRRLLLEFVRGDPGANFREIVRRTGLDLGTVRHHLTVLVRSGCVVERAHGATMRFFDAEAAHDGDWVEVVLRREPALAALHDWLKLNPGVPQSRVLEAMAERGWPRSSTQHRLARLAEAGLARVVPQGRFLLHSAASPDAVEPGDLAACGPLPPASAQRGLPLHASTSTPQGGRDGPEAARRGAVFVGADEVRPVSGAWAPRRSSSGTRPPPGRPRAAPAA